MLKFNKILAPLAVSISLAFASTSFAGSDHHGHKKNELRQILKQLDLSQTQAQDVRQLMQQGHEDQSVYRLDMREIRSQLTSLVQNTEWDQQAVEAVLLRRLGLFAQMGWQKANKRKQVWQLLTPQQQFEFVQFIEQEDNRKGKQQESFKFLQNFDLSDQQTAEIEKIRANFENITAGFKAQHQEFRRAQQTLIMSDSLDAINWQALETKYQGDILAMAIAKAQSRHNVWNVLNTEQQTQWQEKTQRRHQQRHGHHKGNIESP